MTDPVLLLVAFVVGAIWGVTVCTLIGGRRDRAYNRSGAKL